MLTFIWSLLLNMAMATCSQQVSGNFISLPPGSSHGERVGCCSMEPPFRARGEEERPPTKPVVREEEEDEEVLGVVLVVVYWCTVPLVSWMTAAWVSGLVQRVRAVPGRGRV
jgi:hypothetical protein